VDPDRVPSAPLVCIGDLVEDVVVWPHGALSHATDNPATIVRARGGSAANVATFASAIVPVRFIGRVGADALGQSLIDELLALGVDARVQMLGRTGSIVIIVDETGERTMYPDRGAAAELADVDHSWIAGAAIVHAPAYGLATETSRRELISLLAGARQAGALVSVDASSAQLLTDPAVVTAIAAVAPDIIFANRDEIGRLMPPGATSTVVVKAGADPVVIRRGSGEVVEVAVPPVDGVRDTIGAGDAFAAGFLAARLLGFDDRAAAVRGIAVAATVLATPGATRAPAQADV
jgi:sugar/nucleoside kinase (ribokinase family)